jgi:hypothetical protein
MAVRNIFMARQPTTACKRADRGGKNLCGVAALPYARQAAYGDLCNRPVRRVQQRPYRWLIETAAGSGVVSEIRVKNRLARMPLETSRAFASPEGKLKRGTVGYICRGPQPAAVGFYYRTADRESRAHAAGFGGEEGVEQPVGILGGDPDAAIRHTYVHLVRLVLAESDHHFARPIRDRSQTALTSALPF